MDTALNIRGIGGCLNSVDWSRALDYWIRTGLLDWPGLHAHVCLPIYLPWAYCTIIYY